MLHSMEVSIMNQNSKMFWSCFLVGLFLSIALPSSVVFAELSISWVEIFGGQMDDEAYSIVKGNDGYVIAGITNSSGFGQYDVWLIKTDLVGNPVLNQTFGISAHHSHTSMLKTDEDSYIFLGSTRDNMGFRDFWVAKINVVNQEWTEFLILFLLAVVVILVLVLLIRKKSWLFKQTTLKERK